MSKLKYFAQKNFIKRRRRHTDSGEHTLSILSAKRELNNETVGISKHHASVLPSKSFQTSISINPSTSTQKAKPESVEKNHISSQDYSNSVVYFLHLGLIIQIELPKFLNFEWLLSTFIEAFDLPKSHSLCFYTKFPNTSYCQILHNPNQLVNKSIIFVSPNSDDEIEMLCGMCADIHLESLSNSFLSSHTIRVSELPRISIHSLLLSSSLLTGCLNNLRGYLMSIQEEIYFSQRDYGNFLRTQSNVILATLENLKFNISPNSNIPEFRIERCKLFHNESFYLQESQIAFAQLEYLHVCVEFIRIDVTQRGCHIVKSEVEDLYKSVGEIGNILRDLDHEYVTLDPKLRSIIKCELETIVHEEEFLRSEGKRLQDGIHKCYDLNNTLTSLKKLCDIQNTRTPMPVNINIFPNVDPEMRNALFVAIRNRPIDHEARVNLIEISNKIAKRKRTVTLKPIDIFTNDIKNQKMMLKDTNNLSIINNRFKLNYLRWLEEFRRDRYLHFQRRPNIIAESSRSYSTPDDISFLKRSHIPHGYDHFREIEVRNPHLKHSVRHGPYDDNVMTQSRLGEEYFSFPVKNQNFLPPVPGPPENRQSYEPKYRAKYHIDSQDRYYRNDISNHHLSVV